MRPRVPKDTSGHYGGISHQKAALGSSSLSRNSPLMVLAATQRSDISVSGKEKLDDILKNDLQTMATGDAGEHLIIYREDECFLIFWNRRCDCTASSC